MQRQHGFAITVVLLVTVVSLLAFLFASATLTIASRSSAAQERASTQSLLAADSGLKTLVARASVVEFSAEGESPIRSWIENQLGTLDLGDGVSATLRVLEVHNGESGIPVAVTVESTGVTETSTRVLVQTFRVLRGPPTPASVAVPGALTSVGTIKNASNAMRIYGASADEEDWIMQNVPLCAAHPGDYAVVDGVLYRVEGLGEEAEDPVPCDGSAIPVTVVSTGGETTISANPTASSIRTIATAAPLVVSGTTSVVEVTDSARVLFGVGMPIHIGGNIGVVTAVDGNELTIEWDEGSNPVGQPEGSVISRDVTSGTTAGDCDIREAAFPDGCDADQNLDDLFFKTFGVTSPQLLKDSLDPSQRLTDSQLRDGRTLSDITWLSEPENNVRGQTGTGILIIENKPGQTITLNVDNNFTGLIYVIGDANIQGNSEHIGAIVVDGAATIDTNVQGAGDKVDYSPIELARALANISFPNPEAGGIGVALADTWRVR